MLVILTDKNTGVEVVKDLDSYIASQLIKSGDAILFENKTEFKVKINKRNKNEKNI